jgi:1,4-alpha-glucan branching enzyme
MPRKNYSKTGRFCRVTFELSPRVNSQRAALCGEFNEWDQAVNPMKQRKDGIFSTTVSLQAGRTYRFRYLLDGHRWENDQAADAYVPNDFGTEDSLLRV